MVLMLTRVRLVPTVQTRRRDWRRSRAGGMALGGTEDLEAGMG